VRADRLVSLVLLLQARGRTTGLALARELGVSVRTIYRDLAALSAAGVPVLAESGPGGGCQLLEGYRFPLRGLRPEEAEALLILGVPGAVRELGLDPALTAAQRQIRVTPAPARRVPDEVAVQAEPAAEMAAASAAAQKTKERKARKDRKEYRALRAWRPLCSGQSRRPTRRA